MPVFAYKGLNSAGRNVNGMLDADNEKHAKQLLRRDGIYPTSIKEAAGSSTSGKGGSSTGDLRNSMQRVSTQDLAIATRQLATLVHAGIPLVDSLAALVDQTENVKLKSILGQVKQDINEGSSFADTLAKHPKVFNALYINMIRAGEQSGALDVVLGRLADFTESQDKLKNKVISTLIYPIIMLVVCGIVVGILFVFVIPKITKIFEAQKVALPFLTRALIAVATVASKYWWLVIAVVALLVWGFGKYINSKKGRPRWDAFILKVPVVGSMLRMLAVSRFARTLATLMSSGVPLLASFDIVKNVVGNVILSEAIANAREGIKEGESIAAPLKRSGHFPPIVTHMIATGEKTGQLEEMLNNVANSYEMQVDSRVTALTSLMEPLIIVMLGAVVACVVFAIIMPMVQLSSFAG